VSAPLLQVDGLSYRYHPGDPDALHEVCLVVGHGEKVGLIGPNGAGKSTLLLHLNGLIAQDPRVRVEGLEVARSNLARIRGRVGMVFQDADDQLFMPTVFEDVAFGPINLGVGADEAGRRVDAALASVGMEGAGERAPHHLSGGEKRRVALATALAMEPALLVLDEPATSLDARGRHALIRTLCALPTAVILAAHDLDLIRACCARCVVMDRGRVVADGPTASILDDQELLVAHGLIVR